MPNELSIIPDETFDRIFTAIAACESRRKAILATGHSETTIMRHVIRNEDLFRRYMQARVWSSHGHVDDAIDIVDTETDPRRAQIRADVRLRYARMVNPKDYAERIDVTLDDKPAIRAAIEAARARALGLRPVCDLSGDEQSQVIEDAEFTEVGTTDAQSDASSAPDELAELFGGL